MREGHLIELLLVTALVDQGTKHALLVLKELGWRPELGLEETSVMVPKRGT